MKIVSSVLPGVNTSRGFIGSQNPALVAKAEEAAATYVKTPVSRMDTEKCLHNGELVTLRERRNQIEGDGH